MAKSDTLYDFISTQEAGVNSDLAPILLPKNVMAWSTNATVRGGFPKPRSPRFLRTLSFPSAGVETAVTTGLFQGAGYYRPDFGPSQLVAQISGRLFTFTESGNSWAVAEITIPSDPNSATASQAWMNQAEKWLIITDGTEKLPIFWDGATARRSYGASVELGETDGGWVVPAIGEVVCVTLYNPYTGPINVPVLANGEYYQIVSGGGASTYQAVLTTVSGAVGSNINSGASIVSRSSVLGYTHGDANFHTSGTMPTGWSISFVFDRSLGVFVIGGQVIVDGRLCTITFVSDAGGGRNAYGGYVVSPLPAANYLKPSALVVQTSGAPDVVIATTLISFVIPAVGVASLAIDINQPYTGPADAVVWIGDNQFTIAAAAAPPQSNTLCLLNLTDPGPDPATDQLIMSIPELPAGRMGAYGLGHQVQSSLDGFSFLYGDMVGGPSGTPANNYRDSVLKTTENTFQVGGGSFRVPSAGEIITSITFTAVLDAAFGQGPLEIGTATKIFTCAVPPDRATWVALENPILTVALIGKGPLGQNSTILANSDTLFRSSEQFGSLIFGRRDFETWGNTPMSSEINRTIATDNRSLLSYGTSVTFDNRLLGSATPVATANGVTHADTVVLNFDPVSSLRGKAPSIWESDWTGLNVLQYVTGIFNGVERCFAFALSSTNTIGLVEQLRTDSTEINDNGTDPISWSVETSCIFKPDARPESIPLVRLVNGRIHVDQVRGNVAVAVSYRPDFHAAWQPWISFTISDSTNPGYLSPIGLGEPSATDCDGPNNRILKVGRFFQLKFDFTGYLVFMGGEFAAVPEPTIEFPAPDCGTVES